mmetsp:Transcript_1026/g.2019  ORF Transcript_1026/g.2019 Transcript_1026/m.2019 type:complete len:134 (-) Transcript_1026:453-854(-)
MEESGVLLDSRSVSSQSLVAAVTSEGSLGTRLLSKSLSFKPTGSKSGVEGKASVSLYRSKPMPQPPKKKGSEKHRNQKSRGHKNNNSMTSFSQGICATYNEKSVFSINLQDKAVWATDPNTCTGKVDQEGAAA